MNAHWDDILEMMMKHSITSKLIAFLVCAAQYVHLESARHRKCVDGPRQIHGQLRRERSAAQTVRRAREIPRRERKPRKAQGGAVGALEYHGVRGTKGDQR